MGLRGLKLEYPVDRYSLDIASPGTKRAVECDGSYWHKCVNNQRGRMLKRRGWMVVRVALDTREQARKLDLLPILQFLKRRKGG